MPNNPTHTRVFDPFDVTGVTGTRYPSQFAASTRQRHKRRLGDHGGLKNFGVNLVTLPPGSASALRHFHTIQDEFIYIVSGHPTLTTDDGETPMRPGQCATFPADNGDGHMLRNDSDTDVVYIEVGDRLPGDTAHYPETDLIAGFIDGAFRFTDREGKPY